MTILDSAPTVAVHMGLAILLFFIVNRIGRQSEAFGYQKLSILAVPDEAPAFNFFFRLAAPVVFLVIAATALYLAGLDRFVRDFYFVALYYVLFRIGFNLLLGRGRLLNWSSQLLLGASIVGLTYLAYHLIIADKRNVLPDFSTIANELWLVIALFLYQVANKTSHPEAGTHRRKKRYLTQRLEKYRREPSSRTGSTGRSCVL